MRLEQDWFRVWEDRPGIWVIEEPLHSEFVKSHLVIGSERAILVDTGMGVGDIKALVAKRTSLPITVVQSHAHNDHIGGAWQFDDVRIHAAEAGALQCGQSAFRLANWFAPAEMSGPLPPGFDAVGYSIPGKSPTAFLTDGELIELGDRTLEVIFAPGHSAGGVVLIDRRDRSLFSTDVVYLRELYLLNPDSNLGEYAETLARLARLVPDIDRLYPSHGPTPISPRCIGPMLASMQSIIAGRPADSREESPRIEGGVEHMTDRNYVDTHDFGEFAVLIAG